MQGPLQDLLKSAQAHGMLHYASRGSVHMPDLSACSRTFRFGLFEADSAQLTLRRNGVRVKIQDQPLRVLLLLLDRPGQIVSREELKQKLWPEGTFVDFDGSLNVILKKLRAAIDDDSGNPRFIETVPRHGYRFVAPVSITPLSPDAPAPVSAPATESAPVTITSPVPVEVKRDWARYGAGLTTACALLLVLAAGTVLWRQTRSSANATTASSPTEVSVPLRQSVAILGFQNLSNQPNASWLSVAFGEMLGTELTGDGKLRLVPAEDVANLRLTSPWSQTGALDPKTTAHLGDALGTDLLVSGSYTVLGATRDQQDLRLDVRLQDAKSGRILTEFSEVGDQRQLFQVVAGVGNKLRDRMGIPQLEETEIASVLSAVPLDREAARFYALGIARLQQYDALAAKDLFQQVTRVDPKFSLGHAMLARAWGQLGYQQMSAAEAKTALQLSSDLPQAERLQVLGGYYESIGHHVQASSIYRVLFSLFPDNVDYGLRLAAADTEAGHGSQVLDTLHRLRRLPPPSSQDPRIDLAEARITTDKPKALGLIREAVGKASRDGNRILYAEARRDECQSLLYSDHPEQATAVCEDAYGVFLAAGNRVSAADTVRLMADYQGTTSHIDEALTTYQRALMLIDGLGDHEKTGAILNNMAIILTNEGKLDNAEQLYRQAQRHFEMAGNVGNAATALVNLADIAYLRGNLREAEKLYQQGLGLETQIDTGNPGYLLYRLADLELTEGKVTEAQSHADQARAALQKDGGGYQYLTAAIDELGAIAEERGDLRRARELFEQSLAIRQKVGETGLVAESREEIAEINLEEGRPQEAEPVLHEVIAEFEKEHGDPDSSSAYTLLSRVMFAQGKLVEARDAANRAAQLSSTGSDPGLRLSAAIQGARIKAAVQGADGRKSPLASEAMQKLGSVIAEARRMGFFSIECEARLALGEIETKLNPVAGRTRLTSLATEARSHGLELVARRAEHSLGDLGNEIAVSQPLR